MRFQPTDIVVPKGGRLVLTIAGSLIVNDGLSQLGVPEPIFLGPSQPSFSPTRVAISHRCLEVSALRFDMPAAAPDLLKIRGSGEAPVTNTPVSDGGGLATAPVCGEGPS